MTRKEYLNLPEDERAMFKAKLLTAIALNDKCFEHADYIVVMSEKEGNYGVRFGAEIYKENDTLTTTK